MKKQLQVTVFWSLEKIIQSWEVDPMQDTPGG